MEKGREKNSLIIGLIAVVIICYLGIDIFTIPIKYYNINQASDYVATLILENESIGPTNETTIEALNKVLLDYYDNGLMESRPKLFINGKEINLRTSDRVNFPQGEYEIILTGYHQSFLIPLKFGRFTDISSVRNIKK